MKLKKGDKIKVIAAKDKSKDGVIDRVNTKQNKILVMGINMYKRHIKKSEQTPEGGVVDLPRPITVSNVVLICPKCSKPTRIGWEIKNKEKKRICKKCKKII